MTGKQILSNHREIDILLEQKFQGLFLFRTWIEEERKIGSRFSNACKN